MGVDETIGESPVRRDTNDGGVLLDRDPLISSPGAVLQPATAGSYGGGRPLPKSGAAQKASQDALAANTLEELNSAIKNYEGCTLKGTASSTVFGDGNPEARLMVIGEAPGADEDRQGRPFVGISGKLMDRMIESIGFNRNTIYITNVVPWRPPGNRKPTTEEVSLCMPFLERHIELIAPEVLLLIGGLAANTVLAMPEGITKLRGKWHTYSSANLVHSIPTLATFHPAYLLRSSDQKRLAWRDMLAVKYKLDGSDPILTDRK